MNQQDPSWLSWVAPVAIVFSALWALVKWMFVATVKKEMAGMHEENQKRFREIEKALAKIQGRIEERWGERE